MPIIRHGLQHGPGEERFIMAFVQVPGLQVVASREAYTHLGLVAGVARVRKLPTSAPAARARNASLHRLAGAAAAGQVCGWAR
jgi:hypothetical protein